MLNVSDRELIERLRKSGLRATSQRIAILRALLSNREHPSAEDIYRDLKHQHPTLSLSTVYKTLQLLAKANQIITIDTGAGRQRFDGYTHKHHHAYCMKCGRIFDVDYEKCPIDFKEVSLPDFRIVSMKIYFEGLCEECSRSLAE